MGASQSAPKITKQDRAILDLKIQRDKVKQYQRRLTAISTREHEIAKAALAAGDKPRALRALRARKYQEGLLEKTDGQLETLQNLVSSIEFALVEKDVLFGLQQGTMVLKRLNEEMSIEKVERLMEDSAEAVAYQREVDELLGSRMTLEEEEAVQAELAALQAELAPEQEPQPALPNAPTQKPAPEIPSTPTEEPVEQEPELERQRQPARERQAVAA